MGGADKVKYRLPTPYLSNTTAPQVIDYLAIGSRHPPGDWPPGDNDHPLRHWWNREPDRPTRWAGLAPLAADRSPSQPIATAITATQTRTQTLRGTPITTRRLMQTCAP